MSLLLFPYLFCIKNLAAAEWYIPDNLKTRTFYERTNWTSFGPDPEGDYTWANISFDAGKKVFSWLEFIGDLGLEYLKSDNHGSTPNIEIRLLGNAQSGYFYIYLGGILRRIFIDRSIEREPST